MKKTLEIYTDGSSNNKTREGGWAFVVLSDGRIKHKEFGHKSDTTNNRMELTAILNALHHCINKYTFGKLIIYTDSKYISNTIHFDWATDWKSKGWKSFMGEDTKNVDLWEEFLNIKARLNRRNLGLEVRWVRGHDGNKYNEMCDQLAKESHHNKIVNNNYE